MSKEIKELAKLAMAMSNIETLESGAEVCRGASIDAYAGGLTTWRNLEGVKFPLARKPIRVTSHSDGIQVQKMYVMSKIINEEAHFFENIIILN